MPRKPILIPSFRTETEEAAWWDAHPEVATALMKRALASGSARRPAATKAVTMRLPLADLETAKTLAGRRGLSFQTYLKMLLHQALEKERRTA